MLTQQARQPAFDMIIVGAGVAGLYMLHRARQAGLRVRLFDAAGGIGGTWYWNRYPGARVDIESFEYSYSFSRELEQDWHWSERYASQPELLRYFEHVADRFGLYEDIQLDTRIDSLVFDEAGEAWTLRTQGGEVFETRFCVMATGCLSAPKTPDIAGYGSFAGETLFTSRWPHRKVDFAGKRVAVIGTGSSAIQMVPVVAREAAQLTVFQRTPNYSIPLRNQPMDPAYEQRMKANYVALREMEWRSPGGFVCVGGEPRQPLRIPAASVSAEERRREFEARWEAGGLCLYTCYTDLLTNEHANAELSAFVRDRLRAKIDDPQLADKLVPRDHPILTKRLCADSGYFETFNRDNVSLVDLRETPLESITARGIVAGGVEHEFDIIVFATGFDAVTGALLNVEIRGRDALTLRQAWQDGPLTYLGLMSAGFPNLFNIAGPGSTASLSSAIPCDEHQVDLVMKLVDGTRQRRAASIEPTEAAQRAWTERIESIGSNSLLHRTNSWYLGANIPGKPRVVMLDLEGFDAYMAFCDGVLARGYEGFAFGAASGAEALAETAAEA
ncbi:MULTISPECIES: flavin-containing monooxygenase [Burkholderia]|uniref:flavin-containing monooxygenase n=1 Tax=Burkholderia TaxID=32008 RepID=UPI00050F5AEF|nr:MULTISPECIES: NAD(P)/FAD-dependent oxidoreductase [Burkholderia]AYQ90792.1 NAD(P)/FAD-dependent oxidoreductase [Burkholderia gladioli]KGE09358.1 cyclohexanone monooxygenase [Burkholderia gladioli]KVM63112.1 cyclohexanone monooxygenase [Burkholderia gladioli]NBI46488.1 NAD(P)/FAD-dependent oxidoreductase [Burkholderia sp. ISTR5]